MNNKKMKSHRTSDKPILLIGWGKDGAADVDSMAKYFPCDLGLECAKAPYANSKEVLGEVSAWLKGNRSAQILYIGAHGAQNGLVPKRGRNRDKIGYRELADCIADCLRDKERPLTIWLGACNSENAAHMWQEIESLPVRFLVTFSEEPHSALVRDVLSNLIEMSDIIRPDNKETPKPLTYLDNDVAELKERFPSLSIHYNLRYLTKVDHLPLQGPESFLTILERRGCLRKGSFLLEAAERATQVQSNDDLASTPMKKKRQSRSKARTVGPKKPPRQY